MRAATVAVVRRGGFMGGGRYRARRAESRPWPHPHESIIVSNEPGVGGVMPLCGIRFRSSLALSLGLCSLATGVALAGTPAEHHERVDSLLARSTRAFSLSDPALRGRAL